MKHKSNERPATGHRLSSVTKGKKISVQSVTALFQKPYSVIVAFSGPRKLEEPNPPFHGIDQFLRIVPDALLEHR